MPPMSGIRRAINLMLALALTGAGGFSLVFLLVYAERFKGWMLMGAITMTVGGLYWLWADFINATPRDEA